jgi:zinc D-Ala-D-Ala dipeptidase
VVFDALRPPSVQQSLFDSFKDRLTLENPGRTEQEIVEMTQTYVSLPSSNPARPSPYAMGGAVDLSIAGTDGALLDMGTGFDWFGLEAGPHYFRGWDGAEQIHLNRRLLFTVMLEAGFTNYPEEWWHFDYGNQFWGHLSGNQAVYNLAPENTPGLGGK